jgi:hypothetical protein
MSLNWRESTKNDRYGGPILAIRPAGAQARVSACMPVKTDRITAVPSRGGFRSSGDGPRIVARYAISSDPVIRCRNRTRLRRPECFGLIRLTRNPVERIGNERRQRRREWK